MALRDDINARLRRLYLASESALDKADTQVERELVEAYRRTLRELRKEYAERLARFGKDGKLPQAEMMKFNRLASLEQDLQKHLKELGVQTKRVITNGIAQDYREKFYHEAFIAENAAGIRAGFGVVDSDAVQAAIVNPLDRIKWPERHSQNLAVLNARVQQGVTTGMLQGWGFQKVAREFRDSIDRNQFEAMRIFRTEGQRAKSAARTLVQDGVMEKGDKLGLELEKVWDATRDSRTRPDHRALHRQPANDDGEWTFPDGTVTKGPGLSGVAKQDIQCRCTTFVQISEDIPPKERERIENEFNDDIVYEEWAKAKGITNSKVTLT